MKVLLILKDDFFGERNNKTREKEIISYDCFKQWVTKGGILEKFFYYDEVYLKAENADCIPHVFFVSLFLRLMARKKAAFLGEKEQEREISWLFVLKQCCIFLGEVCYIPVLLCRSFKDVRKYERIGHRSASIRNEYRPVYLKSDTWLGVKAGGSIAHTTGVLNMLSFFFPKPVFLSATFIPGISPEVEAHFFSLSPWYCGTHYFPLWNARLFTRWCRNILKTKKVSFFYQRYSFGNFTGVVLAQEHKVPLVLEYNGSEVWIARNWDKKPPHLGHIERIERLNLHRADVVVVVSEVMKEELVQRGVVPEKILVNPNGVDPEKFRPDISGENVREKWNLKNKRVVGFIGTFDRWHGVGVLVNALERLWKKRPDLKENTRALLIGGGPLFYDVQTSIKASPFRENFILTGVVPQSEAPQYLAACDLLVASHVPNPDGSRFFGSPTKLFEYMAMGKGIVASRLEQIGEVLKHGETAWLVKPGDVEDLARGIEHLLERPGLSKKMGESARKEVLARFTWREHTRRIVEKLMELVPPSKE